MLHTVNMAVYCLFLVLDLWLATMWLVQVVRLYEPRGFCGHDREGSPVWYHIIRGLDLKGLLLSVSKQELLRFNFWSLELLLRDCEQQSQKVGVPGPPIPLGRRNLAPSKTAPSTGHLPP